jgi:protein ImuB
MTVTPPRLVVVHCPDWPVAAAQAMAGVSGDALPWPPGAPAAVVHANRIVAASPAARASGVTTGMRRRAAQAACPALVVAPHDPARDAIAFEVVLRALEVLTPRLELTEPGTCTFGARGPSRYHGGDRALAGRAAAVVAEALGPGLDAAGPPGVGVADGRFTATVAARSSSRRGEPVVVAPGQAAEFLAPLSVRALPDPELAGLLWRLGVRTLGDFATLDPADVLARFGAAGAAAHQAARGQDPRPPGGRRPPLSLVAEHQFESPVQEMGPVVFLAKALADELCGTLAGDGLVATRMAVRVETEHGERCERTWYRDTGFAAAALVERVRWQLDGWTSREPSTGGVVLLRLIPEEVVADQGRQLGFWGGQSHLNDRAVRAVARLIGVAGPEAVQVPEWRGGRDPAEALELVPALTVDLEQRAQRVVPPAGAGPWPGRLPAPSPAVVHPARRPTAVVDAAGRDVWVSGRGAISAPPAAVAVDGGPARAVVAWAGPWPLEERWWDPATSRRRARLQVVCAGGDAHLLVLEQGAWSIEATYD